METQIKSSGNTGQNATSTHDSGKDGAVGDRAKDIELKDNNFAETHVPTVESTEIRKYHFSENDQKARMKEELEGKIDHNRKERGSDDKSRDSRRERGYEEDEGYKSRRSSNNRSKRSRSRSRSRDRRDSRRRDRSRSHERDSDSKRRNENPSQSSTNNNPSASNNNDEFSATTSPPSSSTTTSATPTTTSSSNTTSSSSSVLQHKGTDTNETSKRRKKFSGWDKPAKHDMTDPIEKARQFAVEQQQKMLKDKDSAVLKANIAAEHSKLCRIYVGSIHFDLSETEVKAAFSPFGNIRNITMSRDPNTGKSKGFCFIEYDYPEAADNAVKNMNGVLFAGRPIKVGRPFHLTPGQAANAPTSTPAVIPNTRIYVGSIYWDLTADDIKTVFQAFGPVKACSLMPNPETGKHKGYGFVDYETPEAATLAIQHMNGAPLGGRAIRVGRAQAGIGGAALSGASLSPTAHDNSGSGLSPGKSDYHHNHEEEDELSISGAQRIELMQKLAVSRGESILSSTTTTTSFNNNNRCVILRNMVTQEEVDDELEEEIASECSKYGLVEKVVIYQDKGIVKIFVHFQQPSEATKTIQALNGRWFGGKMIRAEPFDMAKFEKHDYAD